MLVCIWILNEAASLAPTLDLVLQTESFNAKTPVSTIVARMPKVLVLVGCGTMVHSLFSFCTFGYTLYLYFENGLTK